MAAGSCIVVGWNVRDHGSAFTPRRDRPTTGYNRPVVADSLRIATLGLALAAGCRERLDTVAGHDDGPSAGTSSDAPADASSSSDGGLDPCAGPFASGPATSWLGYGLDLANTRANLLERGITPDTVACLTPRWRLDDLAGVTSTPAVTDGRVYFGDWDGDVHAAAVADGTPAWVTPVGAAINDSPFVTAERVFVGDAEGFLHALDRATGEVQWSRELDAHPDAVIYGSPVVVGGRVIVGVASTELAALMPEYDFRGSIVALAADDGAELWRVYTTTDDDQGGAGVSVWSTPAIDEARGLLYIGTGNTYEPPAAPRSDALLALRIGSGALAWSRQFTAGDVYTIFMPEPQGPDADLGAAPNLFRAGDREVVGVGDKAGVYAALDRDDGETVWAVQLGTPSHLGGIMTTAAVAQGRVFVAANMWSDALFDFGNPEHRAVLCALEAETGTVLWQRPLPHPVFGAITFANGVVVHGTIDGTVHAIDAATGVELWTTPVRDDGDGSIGGGFAVVDGTLWVGHGFWFFTAPAQASGGLIAYGLPATQ